MAFQAGISSIMKTLVSQNSTEMLSHLTSAEGINHVYQQYVHHYLLPYAHQLSTPLALSTSFIDWSLALEAWPLTHGVPVLDIFYSIFAARNCRLQTRTLGIDIVQLYVSYILSTLGGSLLVAYLLAQPPGWLSMDIPFLVYTTSFFLFQLPVISDIMLFITSIPPIPLIIQIFVDITWTTSITSYGFDAALRSPRDVKNSSIGPWIVGIASGIGGLAFNQTFGLYQKRWSFQNPIILSNNIVLRMVVLSTTVYYIMLNPHKLLNTKFTRYQSRATVLAIILLGDTVASNITALIQYIRRTPSASKVTAT